MTKVQLVSILFSCVSAFSLASAQSSDSAQIAKEILDASGVTGGLVVHIGCGDGKLTAALRAGGKAHLFTLTDFLDDSWPHRSYWIFGTQCSAPTRCSSRDKKLIFGRLLVFDESDIYGYGRAQIHWSNQLQDGAYRLFAVNGMAAAYGRLFISMSDGSLVCMEGK